MSEEKNNDKILIEDLGVNDDNITLEEYSNLMEVLKSQIQNKGWKLNDKKGD